MHQPNMRKHKRPKAKQAKTKWAQTLSFLAGSMELKIFQTR